MSDAEVDDLVEWARRLPEHVCEWVVCEWTLERRCVVCGILSPTALISAGDRTQLFVAHMQHRAWYSSDRRRGTTSTGPA